MDRHGDDRIIACLSLLVSGSRQPWIDVGPHYRFATGIYVLCCIKIDLLHVHSFCVP